MDICLIDQQMGWPDPTSLNLSLNAEKVLAYPAFGYGDSNADKVPEKSSWTAAIKFMLHSKNWSNETSLAWLMSREIRKQDTVKLNRKHEDTAIKEKDSHHNLTPSYNIQFYAKQEQYSNKSKF